MNERSPDGHQPKRQKLTDMAMRANPTVKDITISESLGRGHGTLEGRITAAGERVFYYRYTMPDGRRDRLRLGLFSPDGDGVATLTVRQARDRAYELAGLYREGAHNLREHLERERRQAEHAARAAELERQRQELEAQRRLTVRALFDRWQHVALTRRRHGDGARTGRRDGGAYVKKAFERRVFPRIGHLFVADLRTRDFLDIIDDTKAEGHPRTASVLLASLKQMLAFAAERDIVEASVLAHVSRRKIVGPEVQRRRCLSDAELRQLAAQLPSAKLRDASRLAIMLQLGTAVRSGELLGATWADKVTDARMLAMRDAAVSASPHSMAPLPAVGLKANEGEDDQVVKVGFIDLDRRTWHIPDTKSGRPHLIPLSAFTVRVLKELQALESKAPAKEWLFPNRAGDGPVCVKSLGKQIADRQKPSDARLSGRTKATSALALPGGPWRPHDLRRTAADRMLNALRIPAEVVHACLNHSPDTLTGTYMPTRPVERMAEAFNAWGAVLDQLFYAIEPASNVVALPRRKR